MYSRSIAVHFDRRDVVSLGLFVIIGVVYVLLLLIFIIVVGVVYIFIMPLLASSLDMVVEPLMPIRRPLVRADDELAQELVAQTIKVVAVELGLRALLQVFLYITTSVTRPHNITSILRKVGGHTMLIHMPPHLSQRITHRRVRPQQMMMLPRIPLLQAGELG